MDSSAAVVWITKPRLFEFRGSQTLALNGLTEMDYFNEKTVTDLHFWVEYPLKASLQSARAKLNV